MVRGGARLEWVGVFVDQSPAEIAVAAARLELGAVQLHGRETPDGVARVRAAVPREAEVWKAVQAPDRLPLRAETGADRVLLDSSRPAEPTDSRRSMSAK